MTRDENFSISLTLDGLQVGAEGSCCDGVIHVVHVRVRVGNGVVLVEEESCIII